MPHEATAHPQLAQPSTFKMLPLALLRIAVGWHFLYERLTRLFDLNWTAAGYLQSTTDGLAGFYHWMASDPTILSIVDAMNVWGLILIGACLMLGLFTRLSAVLGIAMLGLYYVAHPPLPGVSPSGVAEGSYLLVNKNLIEFLALAMVVVLPTDFFGLNGFLTRFRRQDTTPSVDSTSTSMAKEVAGTCHAQLVQTRPPRA